MTLDWDLRRVLCKVRMGRSHLYRRLLSNPFTAIASVMAVDSSLSSEYSPFLIVDASDASGNDTDLTDC
jgi:hypothetical protein